jgi:hypothetical protein
MAAPMPRNAPLTMATLECLMLVMIRFVKGVGETNHEIFFSR